MASSNAGLTRPVHGGKGHAGFTLVELVVIMIIIGVLAVVALPRFADKRAFDTHGYAQQVVSALRYAQKTAIAQRRRVQVTVGANSVALAFCTVAAGDTCSAATNGCAGAIVNPAGGGANYVVNAPGGVALNPAATFRFDCHGRPMANDTAALAGVTTITVSGDANIAVLIEPETGYVH